MDEDDEEVFVACVGDTPRIAGDHNAAIDRSCSAWLLKIERSPQASTPAAAAGGKRKRARAEPADLLPTACTESAGSGPEERVDRSPLEEILTDCQLLDGPLTKNQSVRSLGSLIW